MRYTVWMMVLCSLVLCMGCGTKKPCTTSGAVAQPDGVKIQADYSGDTIRLFWKSEKGKTYTVYSAESLTGDWQPLEGASHLMGTGNQIEYTTPKHEGNTHYYRLKIDEGK